MPLKKRPLDRDGGKLRDATLVIVASEDTHAVKQYFERFTTRRVQFVVLNTTDGRSSPASLVERLSSYQRQYDTGADDQFWVCLDQDHWANPGHVRNLSAAIARCRQKGFRIAISNPCFEVWIMLHFTDIAPGSTLSSTKVHDEIAAIHNGYNKAKCCGHLPITGVDVQAAMERARKLDTAEVIPTTSLTRVHLIVDELQAKEVIDFS